MTVKQYFTPRGVIGGVLFVISPVIAGLCYFFWASRPSYETSNTLLYVGALFSMLELASIPMMLIGREYEVEKPR